ncbi:putative oxidoreductase C2F3.05c [Paramyrothecium foliicola]|nr:putative oxidoreductase C2F3.05c [Paramyrothecium foliicola]
MKPKSLSLSDTIQIPNTTVRMPLLGYGVYKIRSDACVNTCMSALSYGYRHIDSARLYRNEAAVRTAVQQSSVPREDLFLTTKASRPQATLADTVAVLLESVEKLGGAGGYVDLLLIHIPGTNRDHRERLWRALEKLHEEGRARAIGVSNFHIKHIKEMREYAQIWPPHVNQIELHPWCQQRELVQYCQDNGIILQAYSPLATGARLNDPALGAIASKHERTPAQILIRYSLQKGWVPLPKSQRPERIKENANVFDFYLDEDDIDRLNGLDLGRQGALFPANAS